VRSLQAGLHAAGARASITSLWKTDDVAALDLMRAVYRGLWRERLAPEAALWKAKVELRDAGEPASRWAGWVLVEAR
jgi:CHAT domain-containing protein